MTEMSIGKVINSKFFIIGVTGPLNSGCTTFAKFVANDMRAKIEKINTYKYNENIDYCYKKINELVEDPDNNLQIAKANTELRVLLRNREVSKTLNQYNASDIYYLSLSKMLIKCTIEYLMTSRRRKFAKKYEPLLETFVGFQFNKKQILKINGWIKRKRYRNLKPDICKIYDEYLCQIDEFIKIIKQNFDKEVIGDLLQDIGDNIRKTSNPFSGENEKQKLSAVVTISNEANLLIKYFRNRQDEKRVHHFVIENFRNPREVEFFRNRYYEFYLVAINSDKLVRSTRFGFSETRDFRDQGTGAKVVEYYKQNVSKCVSLADIVINNNDTKENLYDKWLSYFALIIKPGTITPTRNELFMNQASSMAVRSSCISRQVGALIVGKNGYVIGAGWNDAGEGQIGCGYRQIGDLRRLDNETLVTNPGNEESFRRLLRKRNDEEFSFCFKDEYSKYEVKKKTDRFIDTREEFFKKYDLPKEEQKILGEWLEDDIKIKRLEYCRALHAEENALLQSSKIGGLGVVGGTIYTTAFPCELCAKKIYQSGIDEVVFVEPYPESISQDVIFKDGPRRVRLTPFEGVMSHSYFRLYKPAVEKKELQQLSVLRID